METKKKKTVRSATYDAFNLLGNEFPLLELIRWTRTFIERPYLTDGTITRRLRELRADHLINYKVIDTVKAIYKKMEVV